MIVATCLRIAAPCLLASFAIVAPAAAASARVG